MKPVRNYSILLALLCATRAGSVAAQDLNWYERASNTCSGPTALPSVLSAIGYTTSQSLEVSPDDKVYAVVQASQVLAQGRPSAPYIAGTLTLDANQAKSLRDFFSRQSDTGLPAWADATLGFIVGAVLPTGPAFAAGAAYALFDERLRAASISSRMTALLIAQGGQIERVVAPKLRPDSGLYLIVVDRYVTSVAAETRSIALRSCLVPAKLEVRMFKTVGDLNNKEIRHTGGDKWIQYDLEESKTDHDLTYLGQDEEFFYFKQDARRIRISTRGGPMQHARDSGWGTLYAKTEAM